MRRPASHAPTAVDDVDRAGGEGRLVAGEVDRQGGDLVGRAEAAGRLALEKESAGVRATAETGDPLVERGRLDRARADRVAADALADIVDRDRFGEADDGSLGRSIDEAQCRAL